MKIESRRGLIKVGGRRQVHAQATGPTAGAAAIERDADRDPEARVTVITELAGAFTSGNDLADFRHHYARRAGSARRMRLNAAEPIG
ncbi:hypothetical protein A5630_15600 [Mycolicibacterium mucogenicum]|uniref:Uncharacterized protein n=1 Tax=Mycolicibacterium mucogenicum TaxID=56689 RepID=A0A1A3HB36_MYCMU|nr:hypothetical protein [Mycolicibacterium mucogenicum]OBJ44828.1 hypothetical protein A5630_15600 [Mycolicibacterium mucogenicum]